MVRKDFIKDKIAAISFLLGILANLSIWFFLFFKIKPSDLPITLHYNIYFGVDYLGKYSEIYTIPTIGLVILFANGMLGNYIYKRSKLASRALAAAVPIAQLLLLAGAIAIAVFNM